MTEIQCPECKSTNTYESDQWMNCCDCFHEWNANQNNVENSDQIKDSNGNPLQDGDDVIVIKDLPVKGAPKPIKMGTKVKNIKLIHDEDHDIYCKIDGFGTMYLKSIFVKKS
jgi:protein PhnA